MSKSLKVLKRSNTLKSENKWVSLVVVSLGMFLGSLDLSVNVALPAITADLASNMSTVQWVIILYIGTTTGLQLTIGRVADAYGLKRFYIIGVGIYTVAVSLIGLSNSLEYILGFRVLQAIGFAMIMATTPAIVVGLFSNTQRGRALGTMMSIGTLGMIAATLGGGVLIEHYGWNAIFTGRLPLGVVALILATFFIPASSSQGTRSAPNLITAILLFIGIVSLVLAINLGVRLGWTHLGILALILMSSASLIGFSRYDSQSLMPILDTSTLSSPAKKALIAAFFMSFTSFINLFLLPYFLSDVIQSSASQIGILLMLPGIVAAFIAPVAGLICDKKEPSSIAVFSMLVITISLLSFSTSNEQSSMFDIGLRLALFGLGMGAFQTSNAASFMREIPPDKLGMGSALLAFTFNLGMVVSLGVMNGVFAIFLSDSSETLNYREAFVPAFNRTYLTAAVILVIGILVSTTYRLPFSSKSESS